MNDIIETTEVVNEEVKSVDATPVQPEEVSEPTEEIETVE